MNTLLPPPPPPPPTRQLCPPVGRREGINSDSNQAIICSLSSATHNYRRVQARGGGRLSKPRRLARSKPEVASPASTSQLGVSSEVRAHPTLEVSLKVMLTLLRLGARTKPPGGLVPPENSKVNAFGSRWLNFSFVGKFDTSPFFKKKKRVFRLRVTCSRFRQGSGSGSNLITVSGS